MGNQRGLVIFIPQQALDIGHQNQVFGAQSRRNPCRSGIGVDVVYLAFRIGGDGCDDRDKTAVERVGDRFNIDAGDFADEAEIFFRFQLFDFQHLAVGTAQTQRTAAVGAAARKPAIY